MYCIVSKVDKKTIDYVILIIAEYGWWKLYLTYRRNWKIQV